MPQTKTKKAATPRRTRAKKAANSPAPCKGCKMGCKDCGPKSVRYCGPTSHPSHHHAAEAAEGSRHVWAASVVAGLAIVLTAAIAFTAVQAETEQREEVRSQQLRGDIVREIRAINQRIDGIEAKVDRLTP
ncbi:hypothetical protein GF380_02705 [Candidatus Uhrbacteria bacterium]|nr:hypothetical protein [Candidatus Uhrbacteria bacterium]MBD3284072.1 hypothetical protein [Candidatus Uhrbacteria bacterium]